MAKKKSNTRDKSRDKPRRRSWLIGLFRFLFSTPVWQVLLFAIVAGAIWWQWIAIVSWARDFIYSTLRLFGWGLVFIVIAAVTLVVVLWRRKLSSFIYHGNRWLGSVAFILAGWGILAYFPGEGILRGVSLGGNIGLSIVGYTGIIGVLRLLGLVVIGIILVAPKASFRLVARTFLWIGRQLKRQPVPRLARQRKMPSPPLQVTPAETTIVTPEPLLEKKRERKAAPSALSPAPTQQELKQVAQEVWKKYGESPDLVMVDGWRLPPIDILDTSPEVQFSQADNVQRAKLIEEALASYGVEAKVVQINAGPTVTQFGVEPGWDRKMKEVREKDRDGNVRVRQEEVSKTRVKVERISSLSNDMALALAAPSIRIEAPVPGKSVVGIEVPNTVSSLVSLRGVIETSVFQKTLAKSKLSLALGKGAGGEAVAGDLAKMPHLLIAGATGSGKTVCLNTIICCLLLSNTPNDVRFIMIDPKRVELTMYNGVPHLATPVIVDAEKAVEALR